MDPQELLSIANALAASGASRDEIVETIQGATGPHPQRQLNEEEYNIFAGAISRAVSIMPAFRDAIALIRPFRDYTAVTLYTDRHSRVGIGTLFFLPSVSPHKRASLLLHEAMHVLNNHFTRRVDFHIDPENENSAKDLEINSLLDRHPKTDLSMLLLPSQEQFRFPEAKSFEQYAQLMRDRGMIAPEPMSMSMEGGPSEPSPDGQGEKPEDSPSGSGESEEDEKSESEGSGEPGEGESDEDSDSEGSGSEGGEGESDEDSDGSGESGDSDGEGDGGEEGSESSSSGSSEGSADGESEGESSESSGSSSGGGGGDADSMADEAMEGSGESGSGAPPKGSCDRSSSQREQAADDLKIEKASSTEQSVARNNTVARIREEAARSKAAGDRAALMMLQKMEMAMEPSKVDWRVVFRNIISNSRDSIAMGRTEHTYRRVNRRLSTGEFVFPGMVRYEPSTIMAIDTSGSMSVKDYAFLLSELETIVKSVMRAKDRFKAFCVDAAASEPQTVKTIKDLDLRGGGGTKMEMAVRSVEMLKKKDIPDIFILATDGGTSWPAFHREMLKRKHKYRVVVLITQTNQFEVAKATLKGLADVIDISEEGKGEIA